MESYQRAIEELARGREFANKLQEILLKGSNDIPEERLSVEDLAEGVLKSFTNTLSILDCGDLDEVSQVVGGGTAVSRSEVSEESSRCSRVKYKRGCYKRRMNSNPTHVYSPNWNHDGRPWRKYGQKEIIHAKYHRNYFSCTHKNDQGCQATKQVQRIQEDPPLYKTTYFGNHTCKSLHNDSGLLVDDLSDQEGGSTLLNFSTNDVNKQDCPLLSSMKHDNSEEPTSDVTQNQSSSSNYLVLSEVPAFGHEDVIPGVDLSPTSAHSFIDYVMDPTEFSDFWS